MKNTEHYRTLSNLCPLTYKHGCPWHHKEDFFGTPRQGSKLRSVNCTMPPLKKAIIPQLKKSTQRSRNVSTEDRPRSDDDGLQRRSRSMDAFPKGLPRPSKPTQQGQRRPRPRGDGEVQSNIDVFYQSRTQSCDR